MINVYSNDDLSLLLYNDLLNDDAELNAWVSSDNFKWKDLSSTEIDTINNCNVLELRLEKLDHDFDTFFSKFLFLVENLLLQLNGNPFIFKSDFKKAVFSKLRSYKGILPKKIKESSIEVEIQLDGNYSIIAALTKLTLNNIKDALNLFDDSSTSFISTDQNKKQYSKEILTS